MPKEETTHFHSPDSSQVDVDVFKYDENKSLQSDCEFFTSINAAEQPCSGIPDTRTAQPGKEILCAILSTNASREDVTEHKTTTEKRVNDDNTYSTTSSQYNFQHSEELLLTNSSSIILQTSSTQFENIPTVKETTKRDNQFLEETTKQSELANVFKRISTHKDIYHTQEKTADAKLENNDNEKQQNYMSYNSEEIESIPSIQNKYTKTENNIAPHCNQLQQTFPESEKYPEQNPSILSRDQKENILLINGINSELTTTENNNNHFNDASKQAKLNIESQNTDQQENVLLITDINSELTTRENNDNHFNDASKQAVLNVESQDYDRQENVLLISGTNSELTTTENNDNHFEDASKQAVLNVESQNTDQQENVLLINDINSELTTTENNDKYFENASNQVALNEESQDTDREENILLTEIINSGRTTTENNNHHFEDTSKEAVLNVESPQKAMLKNVNSSTLRLINNIGNNGVITDDNRYLPQLSLMHAETNEKELSHSQTKCIQLTVDIRDDETMCTQQTYNNEVRHLQYSNHHSEALQMINTENIEESNKYFKKKHCEEGICKDYNINRENEIPHSETEIIIISSESLDGIGNTKRKNDHHYLDRNLFLGDDQHNNFSEGDINKEAQDEIIFPSFVPHGELVVRPCNICEQIIGYEECKQSVSSSSSFSSSSSLRTDHNPKSSDSESKNDVGCTVCVVDNKYLEVQVGDGKNNNEKETFQNEDLLQDLSKYLSNGTLSTNKSFDNNTSSLEECNDVQYQHDSLLYISEEATQSSWPEYTFTENVQNHNGLLRNREDIEQLLPNFTSTFSQPFSESVTPTEKFSEITNENEYFKSTLSDKDDKDISHSFSLEKAMPDNKLTEENSTFSETINLSYQNHRALSCCVECHEANFKNSTSTNLQLTPDDNERMRECDYQLERNFSQQGKLENDTISLPKNIIHSSGSVVESVTSENTSFNGQQQQIPFQHAETENLLENFLSKSTFPDSYPLENNISPNEENDYEKEMLQNHTLHKYDKDSSQLFLSENPQNIFPLQSDNMEAHGRNGDQFQQNISNLVKHDERLQSSAFENVQVSTNHHIKENSTPMKNMSSFNTEILSESLNYDASEELSLQTVSDKILKSKNFQTDEIKIIEQSINNENELQQTFLLPGEYDAEDSENTSLAKSLSSDSYVIEPITNGKVSPLNKVQISVNAELDNKPSQRCIPINFIKTTTELEVNMDTDLQITDSKLEFLQNRDCNINQSLNNIAYDNSTNPDNTSGQTFIERITQKSHQYETEVMLTNNVIYNQDTTIHKHSSQTNTSCESICEENLYGSLSAQRFTDSEPIISNCTVENENKNECESLRTTAGHRTSNELAPTDRSTGNNSARDQQHIVVTCVVENENAASGEDRSNIEQSENSQSMENSKASDIQDENSKNDVKNINICYIPTKEGKDVGNFFNLYRQRSINFKNNKIENVFRSSEFMPQVRKEKLSPKGFVQRAKSTLGDKMMKYYSQRLGKFHAGREAESNINKSKEPLLKLSTKDADAKMRQPQVAVIPIISSKIKIEDEGCQEKFALREKGPFKAKQIIKQRPVCLCGCVSAKPKRILVDSLSARSKEGPESNIPGLDGSKDEHNSSALLSQTTESTVHQEECSQSRVKEKLLRSHSTLNETVNKEIDCTLTENKLVWKATTNCGSQVNQNRALGDGASAVKSPSLGRWRNRVIPTLLSPVRIQQRARGGSNGRQGVAGTTIPTISCPATIPSPSLKKCDDVVSQRQLTLSAHTKAQAGGVRRRLELGASISPLTRGLLHPPRASALTPLSSTPRSPSIACPASRPLANASVAEWYPGYRFYLNKP